MTLIRQAIARDNFPDPFDVSAAPPDDDSNPSQNVISLYLFHVIEDGFRKNLPPLRPVQTSTPVQYSEMGLTLNYVVTARNTSATLGGDRALFEQRLLGFVARALHDFPVITDSTVVPPVPPALPNAPIFQTANLAGGNNRIEIILRPVTIEETVNFWSAEQDITARLALFYEARVILLSTPPVTSLTGIVYSLGGFVSVSGQPFLESVRNMVGFIPPPGFAPSNPASPFQFLVANPARVALFPGGALVLPTDVPPENNRLRVSGSDLRDDRTYLAMRGQAGIGAAAPTEMSFRIDTGSGANPDWTFDVRDTEINVSMRQAVQDDQGTALTIYPGLFSLRVVTAKQLPNDPNGRLIEQSSNEQVFAIIPQIVSIAGMGGPANARQFRLTLLGGYLRDELDIQVSVAGRVLIRNVDPTIAGNYDFAPNAGVIDFAVDTTSTPSPLPVNLLINGAGSTPAWAVFL